MTHDIRFRWSITLALVAGAGAGCFDAGVAPTCTITCAVNEDCPGDLTCSEDHLCNTTAAACAAPTCTNADFSCVDRSNLMACGTAYECPLGCVDGDASTAAHCKYITPNWLGTVCSGTPRVDRVTIDASKSLDTDVDAMCTSVLDVDGGTELCLIAHGEITIAKPVTVTATGVRPLAMVATGALTIHGTLDASADHASSGAGGGHVRSGDPENFTGDGGGGAGFLVRGGDGGNGDNNTTNTPRGGENTPVSPTLPFSGGARPVGSNGGPAVGGAGGGVILVSCTARVSIDGTIDVNGGGGGGGSGDGVVQRGAAGGGSGGVVVLQGVDVELTSQARMWANGGGGGGGCTVPGRTGEPGSNGARTTAPVNGGANCAGGGAGGSGGSSLAGPTNGLGTSGGGAGGGGASPGRFHTYTPMRAPMIASEAVLSPATFEVQGQLATP